MVVLVVGSYERYLISNLVTFEASAELRLLGYIGIAEHLSQGLNNFMPLLHDDDRYARYTSFRRLQRGVSGFPLHLCTMRGM
jgi:hypothetical protein